MYFISFQRQQTGCYSYLLGSAQSGEALVVDPSWEIQPYLEAAARRGLRISGVIETHAHADHLSGARRLAQATTAPIMAHPAFDACFPVEPLREGSLVCIGEVELRVLHTPGHRPEALTLELSDRSRAAEPWALLSGDTLFVNALGRPDLGQNPEAGADQLYTSIFERLLRYPDYTEIFPAHGAGSACGGRAMSAKPSSTIGFERRYNSSLQAASPAAFRAELLRHLAAQPPNFLVTAAKNRGALPVREIEPRCFAPDQVAQLQRQGIQVLDIRTPALFSAGYIVGSVNAALDKGSFASNAAWAVAPERPLLLVAESLESAARAAAELKAIGLDWVEGYLVGGPEQWQVRLEIATLPNLSAKGLEEALRAVGGRQLVDVRSAEEWDEGHIPAALWMPLSQLDERLGELDPGRPVAFICESGVRSTMAASKARLRGLEATSVSGGMAAWHEAGLGVVEATHSWPRPVPR